MSQSSGSSGDLTDDECICRILDEHVQGHVTEVAEAIVISPNSLVTPLQENAEPVRQNVSIPTLNPSNINLQHHQSHCQSQQIPTHPISVTEHFT